MFFNLICEYTSKITKYKDSMFKGLMIPIINYWNKKKIISIVQNIEFLELVLNFIKFEIYIHNNISKSSTNKIKVKNSWIAYTTDTSTKSIKSFWLHIKSSQSDSIDIDIYSHSNPINSIVEVKAKYDNISAYFTIRDKVIDKTHYKIFSTLEQFIREYIKLIIINQFSTVIFKYIEGGDNT